MIKKYRSHVFLTLLFAIMAAPAAARSVPSWLAEAAKLPTPAFKVKDVPAVVLLNEESISISSNGTVTRTNRYAVRILLGEGRDEAVARIVYQTDSDKIEDLDAWLLSKTGKTTEYGKKEGLDIALQSNDLYNEARVRLIDASDDAGEGDVFGYESVTAERSVFSQFQFHFQDHLPVISSQFRLTIPDGWRTETVTFNRPDVAPAIAGTTHVWHLRDLPPIPHEAGSPSILSLAPRIAVSFFPTEGTATQIRTFSNWNDVARWMAEIEEPQMTINDELAAKAQELTAGLTSEFEKIAAISRYVQNIQYISIQIGTGRGGGYVPKSATEVFARSYGDCKDKANLMRAMLSVIKIPAYLVSITANDPTFVREEWASPHQFNHCIIAIKISDDTEAFSVVTHPALGRLLMFDPTDAYTPLGDLPEDEQGSWALIDHKDTHELIKMPVMPAEMNRLDRSIVAILNGNGSITGTVREKTIGQSASTERSQFRNLSSADYARVVQNWIGRGAAGAKTSLIEPKDDQANGSFDLTVDFSAAGYAQIMQNRLMVFRPAIIGRLDRLSLTEGTRVHPYMIDAMSYGETVRIKLPTGFAVDEMPEPADVATAFGKYSANYKVDGEFLVFNRSLRLDRSIVPAEKYDTVRSFFGKIHQTERSPVVLIKK